MIAPIDESGIVLDGFGSLSGRDVRDVAEPIVEHLKATERFYRLEPIRHRYPHCWRCGTPLLFRLVDEWFISMGPVYDQPRETLSAEQVDASLRYQIMEVVDRIRWIPEFGYERELDWLLNMHDWMITQEALLGPGAADLRLRGLRDVRRHRRPRRAARPAPSRAGSGSRAIRRTGRGSTR